MAYANSMSAEMGFQRARARADRLAMSSKATAPDARRIEVKLAASMLPVPRASRHRMELAANETSASAVRTSVRRD
jgi:hypothetical protein